MMDIAAAVELILMNRRSTPVNKSMLVAVSGIDGSGKGYLTARIVAALQGQDIGAVAVNIDGWQNLPSLRFSKAQPAEHFYQHAIRFEEMFDRLVLPLQRQRSIGVEVELARTEETATDYYRHRYEFQDVDVIVLEGIFLLKRALRHHYHLAMWIDCSFETALERALRRGQEGLSTEETIRAYSTIFFPAQRIHLARDDPRSTAEIIVSNDPRLAAP
jgi:uridine kinase